MYVLEAWKVCLYPSLSGVSAGPQRQEIHRAAPPIARTRRACPGGGKKRRTRPRPATARMEQKTGGGRPGTCGRSNVPALEVSPGVHSVVWRSIHIAVYCTELYCAVLYCTVLYYTILYYTILYFHHILKENQPKEPIKVSSFAFVSYSQFTLRMNALVLSSHLYPFSLLRE